jgi:hypothetical protein
MSIRGVFPFGSFAPLLPGLSQAGGAYIVLMG